MDNRNRSFSMIADVEGDYSDLTNMEMPEALPILAVRNLVLFPGVVSPILIGRESSMRLVRKAEKGGGIIGIICQKDFLTRKIEKILKKLNNSLLNQKLELFLRSNLLVLYKI